MAAAYLLLQYIAALVILWAPTYCQGDFQYDCDPEYLIAYGAQDRGHWSGIYKRESPSAKSWKHAESGNTVHDYLDMGYYWDLGDGTIWQNFQNVEYPWLSTFPWYNSAKFKVECMPISDNGLYDWSRTGVCTTGNIDADVIEEDFSFKKCMEKCYNNSECVGMTITGDGCYPKRKSCVALDIQIEEGGGVTFSNGLLSTYAVGRQAYQSSDDSNWNGLAGYAVDGDMNPQYFDYSCSHTQEQTDPWWAVDLGKLMLVTGVVITNRQDCCDNRLADFTVAVGFDANETLTQLNNYDFNLTAICGEQIGPVSESRYIMGCTAPVVGQMVVLYMKGIDNVITICEIEVGVEKPSRFYLYDFLLNFKNANDVCNAYFGGGHLLQINNEVEYNIFRSDFEEVSGSIGFWVDHTNESLTYQKKYPIDHGTYMFNVAHWSKSCTASSQLTTSSDCEKVYDSSLSSDWITNNAGSGSYVKLTFHWVVTVYRIRIMQRFSSNSNFKKVRIIWSDGSYFEVILKQRLGEDHTDLAGKEWDDIEVDGGMQTDSIKIEAISVYGTAGTGMKELEVYGVPDVGFTLHQGYCDTSNSYTTSSGNSEECANKCIDDEDCQYVVWDHYGTDSNKCWLYKQDMCDVKTLTNDFYIVTFKKTDTGGYVVKYGDCPGNDLYANYDTNRDIDKISSQCMNMRSCVAFNYERSFKYSSDNRGWTKHTLCAQTNTDTFAFFIKRDRYPLQSNYAGCYKAPSIYYSASNYHYNSALSREVCNSYCLDDGKAFSASIQSTYCFCEDDLPALAPGVCDRYCYGAITTSCGGTDAIEVYHADETALDKTCTTFDDQDYADGTFSDVKDFYLRNKSICSQLYKFVCERPYDYCYEDEPCKNSAECVAYENGYTCSCVPGYTGKDCETDIAECASSPCMGGTCEDQVNAFNCSCYAGYTGLDCATDIDECASNPCEHGSTCTDNLGNFDCACITGYTGAQCETDIDDCECSPCQNGAACNDGVNSYSCTCAPGYIDTHCELEIDECATNPCQNTAPCIDHVAMYECDCPAGYSGTDCEIEMQECVSEPCLNGATCLDRVNKYICQCASGFEGTHCEIEVDECAANPCEHGKYIECIDKVNDYECVCLDGYGGKRCQLYIGNPGTWLEWGNYTDCSTTCGPGLRHRTRACEPQFPELGEGFCYGSDSQSKTCGEDVPCPPVNGGWGAWAPIYACSEPCGPGTVRASRMCDTPTPQYNGTDCVGPDEWAIICMDRPCPVMTSCSEHTPFSECSETCGMGMRTRQMACIALPTEVPSAGNSSSSNSSSSSSSSTYTDQNIYIVTESQPCDAGDCGSTGGGLQCVPCEGKVTSDMGQISCSSPQACSSEQTKCQFTYTSTSTEVTLKKGCATEDECPPPTNVFCAIFAYQRPNFFYETPPSAAELSRSILRVALRFLGIECTLCEDAVPNREAIPYMWSTP